MRPLPAIIMSSLLFFACSDDEQQRQAVANAFIQESSILEEQVADRFANPLDPATVVASVDGRVITVADIAAYLLLFPQVSVDDAVSDLVDLHIISGLSQTVPNIHEAAADGLSRGRTISWIMMNIWPRIDQSVAEGSSAVLDNPSYTTLFGTPELRRASHLLIRFGDSTTEEDKTWARERMRVLHAELQTGPLRWAAHLYELQQAISNEAQLHNTSAVVDAHLVFPRVHSGTATWNGVDAVVEPFAAAAFAADARPGQILGPVETEFGVHIILLEGIQPARLVERERMQQLARRILLRNEFQRVFSEEVQRLAARVQMVLDQDVINLLARSADDRMAFEQEVRSSQFE